MSDEREVVWLKPDQVEQMRHHARSGAFYEYAQLRNDAIIALFYDAGLRSNELRQLETSMFRQEDQTVFLPASIQKQFNEGEPTPTTIGLDGDTVRTIDSYLRDRETDSDYLFPAKGGDMMSTRSLRRMVKKVAHVADIQPMKLDYERGWVEGDPDDVSTHTFRHSVAYRMLEVEDGNDIYDVMRRLRHQNIQTTTSIYSHFEAV